MMTKTTPEELLNTVRKFMESRILLSAAELDLYTLLADKFMTAQEIADKVKVTLRGITILLDALAAMGLLEKNDSRYRCTEETAVLLSKNSPASVLPMVMHSVGLWKRWSTLTDVVRHGIERKKPSVLNSGDGEREAFIGAMHTVASRTAPSIVVAVNPGTARKLL